MNYCLLAAMAVLFGISGVPGMNAQSSRPAHEQAQDEKQSVRAGEEAWLEALFHQDAAAMEADEAEDFTLITPAMIVSRKAQLSSMRMQMSQGAAPGSPPAFVVSNQTIRIYGDVAVVSDICSIESDANNTAITAGRYWQTQVWKKEAGKWKIVHVHLSMIKHGM